MADWFRLPSLHRDEALSITPTQVILDGLPLLLMTPMVGGVESEFLECGEMALDSVQPRRARGCVIKTHAVGRRPSTDLRLQMRTIVVQHHVQHLGGWIASANPLEE